jgi:hypothetical protein
MGREVVTKKDVAHSRARAALFSEQRVQLTGGRETDAGAPELIEDKYKDRLLKYIPADVVAIYLALKGFVALLKPPAPIEAIYWTVFVIGLVITVPWQRKIAKITKWKQVLIGTGAFAVWAISLGEPFTAGNIGWYQPPYGAMLLALYTFLIPLVEVD